MIAIPTKARPAGSIGQPQYKLDAANFGGMSGINWDSATSTWTFGSTVSVKYTSSAGGAVTVQAPAIAGNAVITLPGVTSTLATLGANILTGVQTTQLAGVGPVSIFNTAAGGNGVFSGRRADARADERHHH